jgi:hypothetical protein
LIKEMQHLANFQETPAPGAGESVNHPLVAFIIAFRAAKAATFAERRARFISSVRRWLFAGDGFTTSGPLPRLEQAGEGSSELLIIPTPAATDNYSTRAAVGW